MKTFLSIFIFCLVLFLYIHTYFHLKTSDDLEIYEIDSPTKSSLEDICDLRQPITFNLPNEQLQSYCSQKSLLDKYGSFDIKMRDISHEETTEDINTPIQLHSGLRVFKDDKTGKYISENNSEFLSETGVGKLFRINDLMFRPYMVCNSLYDILFGAPNSHTPLRYEINYRNFFYVTEGSVKVKLIPPRSTKYLHLHKDYYNFEFRSPINPWDVQDKYKGDFSKVQSLEVTLKKGDVLFVPAYWWYSILISDNSATILSMKYRTYMNVVATLPYFAMSVLQRQNTKIGLIT